MLKLTAEEFIKDLKLLASDETRANYERIFKGEKSLGVRMGQVFKLAKDYIAMSIDQIEKLLESEFHDVRVGAVSIMDYQARSKKTTEAQKKEIFHLYLRRHDRINNWDLVDRSAIYVVGSFLADKPRDVLYKLAQSKNTWERRTAMVSTAYFIRSGDIEDALKISEILLHDKEELVQKSVGWMLRSIGDKELSVLQSFLDQFAFSMPRPILRNAIEKLDKEKKKYYVNLKNTEKNG